MVLPSVSLFVLLCIVVVVVAGAGDASMIVLVLLSADIVEGATTTIDSIDGARVMRMVLVGLLLSVAADAVEDVVTVSVVVLVVVVGVGVTSALLSLLLVVVV